MSETGDDGAVGLRELNLYLDFDNFLMRFVVEGRSLGAVVGLPAGMLDEKRERREERDGSNVWPGFGRRQRLRISVQERLHGFVAALPEEISFAHRLVGQWRVIS